MFLLKLLCDQVNRYQARVYQQYQNIPDSRTERETVGHDGSTRRSEDDDEHGRLPDRVSEFDQSVQSQNELRENLSSAEGTGGDIGADRGSRVPTEMRRADRNRSDSLILC